MALEPMVKMVNFAASQVLNSIQAIFHSPVHWSLQVKLFKSATLERATSQVKCSKCTRGRVQNGQFDWSFHLLPQYLREAMAILSLFLGSFPQFLVLLLL